MCGLLAYYQNRGFNNEDINEALASLKCIQHRGPDGEGVVLINSSSGKYQIVNTDETPDGILDGKNIDQINVSDYDLFLGHRRLSIIDLHISGHQPMIDISSSCILIFNGEIYNYLELREELKQHGYSFNTNSDSEVLIKSYKHWGVECLEKFNGMWAFLLFDLETKECFISRDRFGIKPLNYWQENDSWIIASEEKQFFEFSKIPKEPNIERVNQLLENSIIGTQKNDTFYANIFQLSKSTFKLNQCKELFLNEPEVYYVIDTENIVYTFERSKLAIEKFNALFNQSLAFTLRADVPVGLGFSGGVDSSRIVYECYHHFQKPETFSAIFPDKKEDESKYMKLVEKHLQLKSNYCYPESDFSKEEFDKLTYHLDAPVPSPSYFAEWTVTKLIKSKKIKVVLVGQGADEVFAGYHHHVYRYLRILLLKGQLRKFKSELNAYCKLKNVSQKFILKLLWGEVKLLDKSKIFRLKDINTQWYTDSKLSEFLKKEILYYQIPFFLKANDRLGMARNIESRYPFLDHELVNFGFECSDDLKIQNGWQKWLVRQSNDNILDEIRWRKDKVGYVMPAINLSNDEKKHNADFLKDILGKCSNDDFLNFSVANWLKLNFKKYN